MALSKSSCFLMSASTLSKESPLSSLARKASRAAIQFSACSQSLLKSCRWWGQVGLGANTAPSAPSPADGGYLELQALVQHHAALHPGLLQVGALVVQGVQLLLDLRASVVAPHQQLLAKLLKSLEGSGPSVDLGPVLLEEGRSDTRVCVCVGGNADTHTQTRLIPGAAPEGPLLRSHL